MTTQLQFTIIIIIIIIIIHLPIFLKSGSPNLLELSGRAQAYNGIALPLH